MQAVNHEDTEDSQVDTDVDHMDTDVNYVGKQKGI